MQHFFRQREAKLQGTGRGQVGFLGTWQHFSVAMSLGQPVEDGKTLKATAALFPARLLQENHQNADISTFLRPLGAAVTGSKQVKAPLAPAALPAAASGNVAAAASLRPLHPLGGAGREADAQPADPGRRKLQRCFGFSASDSAGASLQPAERSEPQRRQLQQRGRAAPPTLPQRRGADEASKPALPGGIGRAFDYEDAISDSSSEDEDVSVAAAAAVAAAIARRSGLQQGQQEELGRVLAAAWDAPPSSSEADEAAAQNAAAAPDDEHGWTEKEAEEDDGLEDEGFSEPEDESASDAGGADEQLEQNKRRKQDGMQQQRKPPMQASSSSASDWEPSEEEEGESEEAASPEPALPPPRQRAPKAKAAAAGAGTGEKAARTAAAAVKARQGVKVAASAGALPRNSAPGHAGAKRKLGAAGPARASPSAQGDVASFAADPESQVAVTAAASGQGPKPKPGSRLKRGKMVAMPPLMLPAGKESGACLFF